MARNIKNRYVYCYDCGSRGEINGVCKICGHVDNPLLPGMVPNIVGLVLAIATAILTGPESRLVLGNVTAENSDTVEADFVISSEPAAGTQLAIGAPVAIVVSLGPAG